MGGSPKQKGGVAAAESSESEDGADSDYVDSDDGSSEDGSSSASEEPLALSGAGKGGGRRKGAAGGRKRKYGEEEEEGEGEAGGRAAESESDSDSDGESSDPARGDDERDHDDEGGENDGEGTGLPREEEAPLRKLRSHFAAEEGLDDAYLLQALERCGGSVPRAREKVDGALAVAAELSGDFPQISLGYLVRAIDETNGTVEAARAAVSADVLTPKEGDWIGQSWGDESNPVWRVGRVLRRLKCKGDWFKVEFEAEEGGTGGADGGEQRGEAESETGAAGEVLEVQLPVLQKGVTWNLMS